ncbi:hypothetical protein [Dyella japonica]|uniref:Uncharacterized protein n=1 Tax=Dyella japonica DSM 16301 TaxID=1440762 RepID=A0A0G9H7I4_9GAMM|nr:hypothetical protein [Dyella japonica]KLD65446.1 hypothetical protein Y882_02700 [Dyella japonica DSM 16301]
MVDPWIKLRTKLPKDGRLKIVSRKCHVSTVTVVGALVTLWCLADQHADEFGELYGYTTDDVDAEVGVPGFCEALPSEWVDVSGEWVKLPDYQEHNGTTGKSRAQATKRKRNERAATPVASESRSERDTGVTREEKSREEQSSVGSSSASAMTEEERDAQARGAVDITKALRRVGLMDVHPARPEVLQLVALNITVEQACLTAAELALKKAGMNDNTELHPELLYLLASGATAAQMLLTPDQHTHLKNSVPKVGYLSQTLIGRARDAARQGDTHATVHNSGRGHSRQGSQGGRESLAARSERARREGDARDDGDPFADPV